MSKQSEAKKKQGYNQNPVHKACENCKNFTSEILQYEGWSGGIFYKEKNMRCTLGGFAVKKRGLCAEHDDKKGIKQ